MACAGPLTRGVRDIETFMKAVLEYDCWSVDEGVLAVPWRDLSLRAPPSSKLTLGYLIEDPKYPVHPPVLGALRTAIQKLEEAGHTIISISEQLPPTVMSDVMESSWTDFAMDPSKTSFGHINKSGEPPIASLATSGLPQLDHFNPELDDVFRINVERQSFKGVFREVYANNGLDAVLMPTYQATAVAHDKYGVAVYTVLANLLDYPAMTLPYQKADKQRDSEYWRYVSPMRDKELVGHGQVVADT
ncbi:hypothetical protein LTR08_000438 [Meristemomyces frigidus]|nr:hypothetical protein LTR08_000438 [Meristemomyces frigidus]